MRLAFEFVMSDTFLCCYCSFAESLLRIALADVAFVLGLFWKFNIGVCLECRVVLIVL